MDQHGSLTASLSLDCTFGKQHRTVCGAFFFFLPDVSGLFFHKVYYGLIVFPQNPHTENLMPKVMVLGITMNSHKWN